MRGSIAAQRAKQFQAVFHQAQIFAARHVATIAVQALPGREQHALARAHGQLLIGAQLGALAARVALAIAPVLRQPAQVKLAGTMVAGKLGVDLPMHIVKAQLVATRALDLAALDAGQIAVPGQVARLAQGNRLRIMVVQLSHDDRPVRIAAQESQQDFAAYAGQAQVAALLHAARSVPRPARRNAYPGRIGIRVGGARAACMLMVQLARGGKAHLDPAHRIAMDFLIRRPHHHGALHGDWRQITARVVGRHDGHAAPHCRQFDTHAQGATVHGRRQFALRQQCVIGQPAVARKQACHPGGQLLG